MALIPYAEIGRVTECHSSQVLLFPPLLDAKYCNYVRRDTDCDFHISGSFVAALFQDGEMVYQEHTCEGIRCRRGSLLLIPPFCKYKWRIERPARTFQIRYDPFLQSEFGEFSLLFGPGMRHLTRLDFPETEPAEWERNFAAAKRSHYPRANLCALILRLFTRALELSHEQLDRTRLASSREQLMQCVYFVEENPKRNISVEDLAKCCNLSASRVFQLFREEFRLSPLQYVAGRKLLHARRMLEATPCPVSEIAEALGFSSVSYFSRFFRKHAGITPRQFRLRTKPTLR